MIGTLWADCHVCSANHAYIVNGKHKPVVEVLLTKYEVGQGQTETYKYQSAIPYPRAPEAI